MCENETGVREDTSLEVSLPLGLRKSQKVVVIHLKNLDFIHFANEVSGRFLCPQLRSQSSFVND